MQPAAAPTHPAPSPPPTPSTRVTSALLWITHQGAPILRQDFTQMSDDEVISLVDYANAEILQTSITPIRELIIITGIKISKRILDYSTEATKRVAHKEPFSAIVGVTGVQKLILQLFNRFSATPLVPFDTESEARAWLADQRG